MEIVDTEYSRELYQGKLIRITTIDLDKIACVLQEMRGQSLPYFPADLTIDLIID